MFHQVIKTPLETENLHKEPKNVLKARNDSKQEPSDSKFNSKENKSPLTRTARKCLEFRENIKRDNERKEREMLQVKKKSH